MSAPGLLALRFALALVFAAHGAHKLFGWFSGPGVGPGGLDETAAMLAALGLGPAFALAVTAGVAQLAGGVLLAVGLFTRWASWVLALYLLAGMWLEHLQWGLFLNWTIIDGRGHGIEYSIVALGAVVCLALCGAGDWSIDGQRALSAEADALARDRIKRKF